MAPTSPARRHVDDVVLEPPSPSGKTIKMTIILHCYHVCFIMFIIVCLFIIYIVVRNLQKMIIYNHFAWTYMTFGAAFAAAFGAISGAIFERLMKRTARRG